MPDSIQRILRIEGRLPEETTVWLRSSKEAKPFMCASCGKLLFRRQHRIMAMVDDNMDHILKTNPLSFQCFRCGHLYRVFIM